MKYVLDNDIPLKKKEKWKLIIRPLHLLIFGCNQLTGKIRSDTGNFKILRRQWYIQ